MIAEDQRNFLIALIVSAPLSYGLRKLKTATQRNMYSLILGTLLQWLVYGWDIWMPILIHISVYGIILVKGRRSGALVTGSSILGLSIYHIYRMIISYGSWHLDISTVLMCMVCKYSLFAYAYEDGGRPAEKLLPNQQRSKLQKLPSFFNYLVYCQFLPTCIIGTAIEYKDFQNFMQMNAPFNNVPGNLQVKEILKDLRISLTCGAVFAFHMVVFPLSHMQDPAFANYSWQYILYFSYFCVTTLRFKYYFGWKLSQVAVHASGISYLQDQTFNRVRTCDPWVVQTSLHLRERVASWNMSCELWLRTCIYDRSPFKNKQISQGYTFMISSFWHGFYGGYYISFFLWFAQINLSAKVFKFAQKKPDHIINKLYVKSGLFGKTILWIFVNFFFTHNGLYFQVLDSVHSFQILKQIWFIPPLVIIGATVIIDQLSAGRTKGSTKSTSIVENARAPASVQSKQEIKGKQA